jgi:hypothetical protein
MARIRPSALTEYRLPLRLAIAACAMIVCLAVPSEAAAAAPVDAQPTTAATPTAAVSQPAPAASQATAEAAKSSSHASLWWLIIFLGASFVLYDLTRGLED